MLALLLFLISGCFGTLEIEGGDLPYGGPFDEQQAQSLWSEIADRESWPAFAGYENTFENAAPHGTAGRLHVNAIASDEPRRLPSGSLIVKYDFEGDAIVSITAVKRIDNFNPDAFDWFWARFEPDGSLARDADGMLLGGVIEAGCIECHRNAPGDDFVFLNGDQ